MRFVPLYDYISNKRKTLTLFPPTLPHALTDDTVSTQTDAIACFAPAELLTNWRGV